MVTGQQMSNLLLPQGTTPTFVVYSSMILAATSRVVRQEAIGVPQKVDVSCVSEPVSVYLRGRWTCSWTAAGPQLRMRGADAAAVPGRRCLSLGLALLLGSAQFRVTESPHHAAEIDEKRPHDHDHERIGFYHGFGDWRCHLGCAGKKTKQNKTLG